MGTLLRRARRMTSMGDKGACIVDQDIDVTGTKFDRSFRSFARTRSVSKIRRDEIRLPSFRMDFGQRLIAAFSVAAYNYDGNAKLRRFFGGRSADATRPSCNKS
jgi:hypothetical protein